MLAVNPTTDVTLKVVTEQTKNSSTTIQLQAIDCNDEITPANIKAPDLETVKPLANKFTITFSYKQQLHRTKVNVAGTAYGLPVYKVALSSKLSNASHVCWLQNTADGWVSLLGDDLDNALVKAITAAIEDQQ